MNRNSRVSREAAQVLLHALSLVDSSNGRQGQMTKIHSRFQLRSPIIGTWLIALPSLAPLTKRPVLQKDIPSLGQARCKVRALRMRRAGWTSAAEQSSSGTSIHLHP